MNANQPRPRPTTLGVAQVEERAAWDREAAGSRPATQTNFRWQSITDDPVGRWCNGSMEASKTSGVGSIPSRPVSLLRLRYRLGRFSSGLVA